MYYVYTLIFSSMLQIKKEIKESRIKVTSKVILRAVSFKVLFFIFNMLSVILQNISRIC